MLNIFLEMRGFVPRVGGLQLAGEVGVVLLDGVLVLWGGFLGIAYGHGLYNFLYGLVVSESGVV